MASIIENRAVTGIQRAPNEHSRAVGARKRATPAPATGWVGGTFQFNYFLYTARRGAYKRHKGKRVVWDAPASRTTRLGSGVGRTCDRHQTRPL